MHGLSRSMHWLVRIVVAIIFLYHGFMKFPVQAFAENMGLPLGVAYLVAIGEVFLGLCIFFGGLGLSWLTRIGGFCMVVIMIGAIVMVKWGSSWQSMEFDVLLLALGLNYLFRGNH